MQMTRTIIHYFTGTGNTAHSVKMIAEQLQNNGHEVKICNVKKDVLPPVDFANYHIIAFPVLSWAAPVMMKQYVKGMAMSTGIKTAILAVNGAVIRDEKMVKGFTGQALEEISNILRRKKYDVFLTGNASFPDNWTQFFNPSKKENAELIFPLGENDVSQFISDFIQEKRVIYRCGLLNKIWTYLTSILFGYVGRRVLGKFYIADEHCTGCEICAKTCPAKTIRMSGKKPYWTSTCEDCNRCINLCPEQAIQVSVPLFVLQAIINVSLTVWAIWAILIYVPKWIQTNQIFLVSTEILIIIIATIILLWVCIVPIDTFFQFLLRNIAIRRFFSISYTKKYRRYIAQGFKPLK
jgi:Pyruvate/2-oxoacid:ferredoxin oxidoreductase delta subunit/menaquinone-dependent protoporphyrinogen IX oxidase